MHKISARLKRANSQFLIVHSVGTLGQLDQLSRFGLLPDPCPGKTQDSRRRAGGIDKETLVAKRTPRPTEPRQAMNEREDATYGASLAMGVSRRFVVSEPPCTTSRFVAVGCVNAGLESRDSLQLAWNECGAANALLRMAMHGRTLRVSVRRNYPSLAARYLRHAYDLYALSKGLFCPSKTGLKTGLENIWCGDCAIRKRATHVAHPG